MIPGLVDVCRGGLRRRWETWNSQKIRNQAQRMPDSDAFPLKVWLYSYIRKKRKKVRKRGDQEWWVQVVNDVRSEGKKQGENTCELVLRGVGPCLREYWCANSLWKIRIKVCKSNKKVRNPKCGWRKIMSMLFAQKGAPGWGQGSS